MDGIMAVNKIALNTDDGEQVLVDLTGDSVSEGKLFEGETAHAANGEKIVGTFTLESEMSEQDTLIEQIKTALDGKAAGNAALPTLEKSVDITENGVVELTPESYNTELQQNNTELQSILAAVNALPDAGGGGNVETCTVEILTDAPTTGSKVYYSSANMVAGTGTMTPVDWMTGRTFTVAKGTILVVDASFSGWAITGNATLLMQNYASVFFVEGNCSLMGS